MTDNSPPIYATNFNPRFCPQCGYEFIARNDKYNRQDFFAGAAQRCPQCDTRFQYVHTPALLDVTPDVKYYLER